MTELTLPYPTAQDNGSSPVFDYALFSNQNLRVSGNYFTVNGSAHSNANMNESGNYESVTDNLEVSGAYSASGNHISEGDLVKNAPLVPMPVIDMNIAVIGQNITVSGNYISVTYDASAAKQSVGGKPKLIN